MEALGEGGGDTLTRYTAFNMLDYCRVPQYHHDIFHIRMAK